MKVAQALRLAQTMGWRWLTFRLRYAIRLRSGYLRRKLPAVDWSDQAFVNFLQNPALAEAERYLAYRHNQAPVFFFNPTQQQRYCRYFADWDNHPDAVVTPLTRAKEVAHGVLRYFEHSLAQVGYPPDWHVNPFTGQRAPADRHWSQIGDFGYGDIKIIWEASRFGFVFVFVRAYWRTGDERYAALFWQLVEDWCKHNPPQLGPNWKCGQETTFRVMAWCFGLYGFLDSAETTAERVAMIAQMIGVSGQRIEANIGYALGQRNNHGISEGVGLWTIGILFPEFKDSTRWRELGRKILEEQGQQLIYEDGSFSQHSVVYHRLMLHDYLWALRLGDLNGLPLSDSLKDRVKTAINFLYQIQDDKSGKVPYYGPNDGSLILPLDNCDYLDFRPLIQAGHYYFYGARCFSDGPWDETLLWIFGPTSLSAPVSPPRRSNLKAQSGGYYTLRSDEGFVFTRCATFRDRPGQADMLHVDLWWRGHNVALDAGTYSYNAEPPWNDPFAHTAYHNTVTVDGQDQMERVGRFLWLPWLKGQVNCSGQPEDKELTYWEGEHDGYKRLKAPVSHRRGILRIGDEGWLVLDAVESSGRHRYRLHWLLMDAAYDWDEKRRRLVVETPAGPFGVQVGASAESECSLVRADSSSPRGWWSPYYYHREPALSLDLTVEDTTCCFWTFFAPDERFSSLTEFRGIAEFLVKRFPFYPPTVV